MLFQLKLILVMSLTGKFRAPYYVVIHGRKPGIYRSKAKFDKAIEVRSILTSTLAGGLFFDHRL